MLSRVAECLYWMSRYVERAENLARIVDVNSQAMLDLPYDESQKLESDWSPILISLGEEEAYAASGRDAGRMSVTNFLLFAREHSNSIVSCLAAARENARTVRADISGEMWEQINRSYLWFTSKDADAVFQRDHYDFFQQIKEVSQLFQGITDSSMVHGEGWEFIQLGKFIERADKTSRVLDEKYHIVRRANDKGQLETLEWSAVLRSCGARQAYQRVYVAAVRPEAVAELLLLNATFPRSVRFCVEEIDRSLRVISGVKRGHFTNAAEKLTGQLLSELCFSEIGDIYARGLHDAVDRIQLQLNDVGEAIFRTYIDPALVTETIVQTSSNLSGASQSQRQTHGLQEQWQHSA
jgi:uncharacterized alpha-E superfamily protein